MPGPKLSRLNLWQRHANAVVSILQEALDLMIADNPHGLEPDLNRSLELYLYEAMSRHRRQGLFVPGGLPMMEARNQPTPDTRGASSESKIPDIQWGYQDSQIADAMRSARFFHIECKRLGSPTLNIYYVRKGIRRFIDKAWSYGKDVASGAMVGYINERASAAVLSEVNHASSVIGVPPLTAVSESGVRHDYDQVLERDFEKSPFRLHHVWIEIENPENEEE